MKTRGHGHSGRRGGIFAQQPGNTKRKKRALKLTKEDQSVVDNMEGVVPLKEWRNELSHIQLALGAGINSMEHDDSDNNEEEDTQR